MLYPLIKNNLISKFLNYIKLTVEKLQYIHPQNSNLEITILVQYPNQKENLQPLLV